MKGQNLIKVPSTVSSILQKAPMKARWWFLRMHSIKLFPYPFYSIFLSPFSKTKQRDKLQIDQGVYKIMFLCKNYICIQNSEIATSSAFFELYITICCQPIQKNPPQIHPLAFQVWTGQGENRATIKTHSDFSVWHAKYVELTRDLAGHLYSSSNEQPLLGMDKMWVCRATTSACLLPKTQSRMKQFCLWEWAVGWHIQQQILVRTFINKMERIQHESATVRGQGK